MDVLFSEKALNQYIYWQNQDRKTLTRINELIKDIERNGVDKGIGKPEKLLHSDGWSRRIDETNRLIYKIDEYGFIYISSLAKEITPIKKTSQENLGGFFIEKLFAAL